MVERHQFLPCLNRIETTEDAIISSLVVQFIRHTIIIHEFYTMAHINSTFL